MSPKRQRTTRNTLFQTQKISAGEIQKNKTKGFSGGAERALHARRRRGLSLRFSPRTPIRFELGCKNPPNQDKIAQTGAKAPVLFGILRFCGAKPICFSGGRVAIQVRAGALFCFLK